MKREYPIDEHRKLPVNGTQLDIRIRGTRESNPVVLFLHGGPGACNRHAVLRDQAPLADECTIVCLDQRGAGKSYDSAQAKRTMNMETTVEDVRCVVDFLRERFHQEKVILVGHSYGSYLGVLFCEKYPERVAAYVGIGQLANGAENERISYEFVLNEAQKRGDRKALKDLNRIGWPQKGMYASLNDLMTQRNLMTKYGGAAHGKKEGLITSLILPVLRSPEYTLADLIRYARGQFYNMHQLWREVISCDFMADVRKLGVPVTLTIGRFDRNTPPELAQAWLDALDAPKKEWIWFEQSAHAPISEESERWNSVFRERVLRA
ncbi:MAG: alpha/beta hydrolase [Eubacteriales bacterium]|nr:alpha/beta hydrolase [Eubacteriales bacterium]